MDDAIDFARSIRDPENGGRLPDKQDVHEGDMIRIPTGALLFRRVNDSVVIRPGSPYSNGLEFCIALVCDILDADGVIMIETICRGQNVVLLFDQWMADCITKVA